MSARRVINTILDRTTGYHLTKSPGRHPDAAKRLNATAKRLESAQRKLDATQRKLDASQGKIEAAGREVARLVPPKPAAPKGDGFPRDFDEEFKETIRAVQDYTMTGQDKLHALISATKYIVRYNIPGAIAECGVWRGGSMHAVARTLTNAGDQSRELYLYDTFAGMTPPGEKDVRHDGQPAAHLLETRQKTSLVWALASLEDVRAGFEQVPYPADKLHFIQGPVEETVPATLPDQIAILRLDTDWYESTAHELTHMYDRLVSGGVLIIDDYGWWQGSRAATDEFLERTGERLLLVRTATGRIAVKP